MTDRLYAGRFLYYKNSKNIEVKEKSRSPGTFSDLSFMPQLSE